MCWSECWLSLPYYVLFVSSHQHEHLWKPNTVLFLFKAPGSQVSDKEVNKQVDSICAFNGLFLCAKHLTFTTSCDSKSTCVLVATHCAPPGVPQKQTMDSSPRTLQLQWSPALWEAVCLLLWAEFFLTGGWLSLDRGKDLEILPKGSDQLTIGFIVSRKIPVMKVR